MSRRGDMTMLPPDAGVARRRLRAAPDRDAGARPAPRTGRAPVPAAGTGQLAGAAVPARAGASARTAVSARTAASAGTAAPARGGTRVRQPARPRPGTRPRPPRGPARPRPAAPPGTAGQQRQPARAGEPGQESRTRFVSLVLGLLGGGLISLLLINTILAAGALQITGLQQANVRLDQQQQALRAKIAAEETPAELYRRARQLGMTEPPLTHFLDLQKGRILSQPARVPGVVTYPRGYAP